ncbi:MAG: chorismate-binding protein [Bacteroidota bacterium]
MNTSISVSGQKISETELLSYVIRHCSLLDFPLAWWRLPSSQTKHLLIAEKHQQLGKDTILEELQTGFIFSPFDRTKDSIYLKADYIFSVDNGTLTPPQTPLEIASRTWLEEQLKKENWKKLHVARSGKKTSAAQLDQDRFMELIAKSIREIEKGTFEKIVPSRTREIALPAEFDVVKAFEKLCAKYPNAFISFVNIPGLGSWLGASPELLVSVEDNAIFKTVALAGTKPYLEGTNLRTVAWTQKEIEEQALVERYVISCFKKIRLREYDEYGPKTVVAGNLMHLKSEFMVDMKATNFPQLGSIMLQLLHPTSAVCGMPLEPALEFLKQNENYDREFYAGYLGPVNVQNNIDIFVNLRCMQLCDTHAILYAGAGVTVDSVAEQEWEETEMKFNTLLNVIF